MRKAVFAKASSASSAPEALSIGTPKDTKTTKGRRATVIGAARGVLVVFVSFVVEFDERRRA
jgi:hypothetical protein